MWSCCCCSDLVTNVKCLPFRAIAQLATEQTTNSSNKNKTRTQKKLGVEEAEQLLPVTGKKEIRQSTKQNQKMCQTIVKVAKWSEQKEK